MSGVEALIGLIAGGAGLVSLALQLFESAAKLKRMLSSAEHYSKTMKRLVFSLETMAIALQELEQRRLQTGMAGNLLERCITDCYENVVDITRTVDQLALHSASHTRLRARLSAIRRSNEIEELLIDVERTKTSLELSYLTLLASELRSRDVEHTSADELLIEPAFPNIVSKKGRNTLVATEDALVLQHSTQSNEASDSRGTIETDTVNNEIQGHCPNENLQRPCEVRVGRVQKQKSTQRKSIRFMIYLPYWMACRIWEFNTNTSQHSWTIILHTYNLVPTNSPIFLYCADGNLEKVRTLIEGGEASPLDVTDGYYPGDKRYRTLLDVAARGGHLEICRYLLSQTRWPDHSTTLNHALGWSSQAICECVEMYRLFFQTPGFEPDFHDGGHTSWLSQSADAASMNLVLGTCFPNLNRSSLDTRFNVAVKVGLGGAVTNLNGFLRFAGVSRSDPRLASLRSSKNVSILHYIAVRIYLGRRIPSHAHNLVEWIRLAIDVLKDGLDPFGLTWEDPWFIVNETTMPEKWERTALLEALGIFYWIIHPAEPDRLSDLSSILRIWAELLQRAGLDLGHYGAIEDQVWKSLGCCDMSRFESVVQKCQRSEQYAWSWRCYPTIKLEGLKYGSTVEEWSLMIRRISHHAVFRLRKPPGSFISEVRTSETISWCPSEEERNEGPWEIERRTMLYSPPMDLRDLYAELNEPFVHLVEGVQDDAGAIHQMEERRSRPRPFKSRAKSQPPPTRRREHAFMLHSGNSVQRRWMGDFHLCPLDLKWRLGCRVGENIEFRFGYPQPSHRLHWRYCVGGGSDGCASVQETWNWKAHNVLASHAHR